MLQQNRSGGFKNSQQCVPPTAARRQCCGISLVAVTQAMANNQQINAKLLCFQKNRCPKLKQDSQLPVFIFTNALLKGLYLQCQHSGEIPAQRQIAPKEPEARMPCFPPQSPQFTLFVKAPNILDAIGQLISKDLSGLRPHILVPSRKHNLVRLQLRPVLEAHSMRQNLINLLALLDLDLPINNEL